jgi:hypothetical protein
MALGAGAVLVAVRMGLQAGVPVEVDGRSIPCEGSGE